MMTIIKQGGARLPLDRVTSLAKALDVDPAFLLLLALEQAVGPTEAATIVEVMGNTVTQNEMTLIKALREASEMSDPPSRSGDAQRSTRYLGNEKLDGRL